jgi:hypothetical protein
MAGPPRLGAAIPTAHGEGRREAASERRAMEVLFKCLQGGKRYYEVRLNGQPLFVGDQDECARYIEIHNRKVAQEQIDDRRTPRSRPVTIRTYRQVRPA